MNSRVKVLTVVGTRPELIKLSRVIAELERHVDHVLVHTGQNFDHELNQVFFDELGIRPPDHRLEVAAPTPAQSISKVIAGVDEVLEEERPDAFLVYGDTNSCLSALAAKRRHIPVFHMEAGNRCFDERVPEEMNRKIIDHLADINMVHSEHARRYLLAEGVRPETVLLTGSPMAEVFEHSRAAVAGSNVLERLGLERGGYFVVSAHREENVDDPRRLTMILETLGGLVEAFDRSVVVSTHPRTRRRLEALPGAEELLSGRIVLAPPFGFADWLRLQADSFCVVSDSGTLTEEAALLGFPAVMLRDAHERPEGVDAGVVAVMSGLRRDRVLQAVRLVTDQGAPPDTPATGWNLAVARQVVRIIVGHVDFVRRTVWREEV